MKISQRLSAKDVTLCIRTLNKSISQSLRDRGLHDLGPRPLSRLLRSDLATVQRVLAALRHSDPHRACAALPGSKGLRKFLTLLEQHAPPHASPEPISGARRALQELEEALDRAGGHRAPKPIDHLLGHPVSEPDATLRYRRASFRSAARIAGLSYDEWMFVHVLMPTPDDPTRMQLLHASIIAGIQTFAHDVVLPMRIRTSADSQPRELTRIVRLSSVPTLIEASEGKIELRDTGPLNADEQGANLWAAAHTRDAHVVLGFASGPVPHPSYDPEPHHIFVTTPRVGVRRIIMDAWVHQSMQLRTVPEVLCAWMNAEVPLTPNSLRTRRFPVPMSLHMGEHVIPQLSPKVRSMHDRASAQLLSLTGLPPAQFRLIRALCNYPLMGFTYVLPLEFQSATPNPVPT